MSIRHAIVRLVERLARTIRRQDYSEEPNAAVSSADNKPTASQDERTQQAEGQATVLFTQRRRVDLWYLITDLLPGPRPDRMGGEEGGLELWNLDELLRRTLSRLSLPGYGVKEKIQKFILTAPEDELLTLIELAPQAQILADRRDRSPFNKNTNEKVRRIRTGLNDYLERIGSRARFHDRRFRRDGFVVDTPQTLQELPDKNRLRRDVGEHLRTGEVASVIFIDLDSFKAVNDQLGHPGGDKCLEVVAELVGKVVAKRGILYRYGGDEFALLLPNFHASEAASTAERIRTAIDNGNPGRTVKVTASIGVACSEDDKKLTSAEEVIAAADEATYVSKFTGKNRVTLWPPSPELKAEAEVMRQEENER